MNAPVQVDPNTTIHARIESNKQQIQSLLPLPNIASIEATIQRLTPRAAAGDNAAKSDLAVQLMSLDEAKKKHQTHARLTQTQTHLQQELQMFEHDQRQAILQSAESQYLSLKNEFGTAAKSLCRLHQQMKEMDARLARSVPGWRSRPPPAFNIPALNPMGWVGDTSDMLPLPWQVKEEGKAA